MQFPLRPYLTAGVALTGAGLIADRPDRGTPPR
jgi:hypothetical protein